jgi:hypothetical protein
LLAGLHRHVVGSKVRLGKKLLRDRNAISLPLLGRPG